MIEIKITRDKVMGAVELISSTIAFHNAGTPTFEQLWASESDKGKLDIWYHNAIDNLETTLMRYVSNTSAQFDLAVDGTDYTLFITPVRYWDSKVNGLLANKVQDYIVHSIIFGWLSDFGEMKVMDYSTLIALDLSEILSAVLYRQFSFTELQRNVASDIDKNTNTIAETAGSRKESTDTDKDTNAIAETAGTRKDQTDNDKSINTLAENASQRNDTSDTDKSTNSQQTATSERMGDYGRIDHRYEDIDLSGSGIRYIREIFKH